MQASQIVLYFRTNCAFNRLIWRSSGYPVFMDDYGRNQNIKK